MDKETEARLAKLIMEEAEMLRKRADREGVHVYLAKPTVRVRPNPQFLRATIRGVEHSNRLVEVNEMWRRREAELGKRSTTSTRRTRGCTSSNSVEEDRRSHREDDPVEPTSCSLRDDEVERFLNSRVKRGRGSVGSRMDEQGPYPAAPTAESVDGVRTKEDWEDRLVGPRLPDKAEWQRVKMQQQEQDAGTSKSKKERKVKKEQKKKKKKRKRESGGTSD